jgi:peptidoglycan/LPS O-acetylase OafA/YrhL
MCQSESSGRKYRSDIDGLRALAVLSVFFFHLQPDILPGGYLGVDVFFVISGYLITGIILRENHLRTFSFIHFYTRRVKRIFPALFVVLALTGIVAILSLPPDSYANFVKSARYASGQFANFFFARKVGYFEEGFSGQPLLHTWSLGVEEQFYLFWPLLICICFWLFSNSRPRGSGRLGPEEGIELSGTTRSVNIRIAAVMVLLSLSSFVLCYFLAGRNYNLAFYMFYTRAVEFCIGGFISLRVLPKLESKGANCLAGAFGLFLLCYSFLFIKEEYLGISFLQFGVLVPCVGTALIIHANWQEGIFNKILAAKIPAAIGKISYSLYLYHWPVIIFYKLYNNTSEVGVNASLGIIAVSFVLSTLSYLLVEQPARKTRLADRRVLAVAAVIVIVFAVSFKNFEKYETAPWRITSYLNDQSPASAEYFPECDKQAAGDIEFFSCNDRAKEDIPIIALVGDSHSPHFLYSTTAWAAKSGYDVEMNAMAACPMLLGDVDLTTVFGEEHANDCKRKMSLFQTEIVDDPRVEIILIALRFDLFHTGIGYSSKTPMMTYIDAAGRKVKDQTGYFKERLSYTVDAIKKSGKEVILVKQVPLFNGARDCDWEPLINKVFGKQRACTYDTGFIEKWQQPSSEFVNEFAAAHHLAVLDPVPFFDGPLHEGINLYKDSDHLNMHGKRFLVPHFVHALDEIRAGTAIEQVDFVNGGHLTRAGNVEQ